MSMYLLPFSEDLANYVPNMTLFENSSVALVEAVMFFILTLLVVWALKKYVVWIAQKAAQKTKTRLDNIIVDVMTAISFPFFIIAALWVATRRLVLTPWLNQLLNALFLLGITYYFTKALSQATLYLAKAYAKKHGDPDANFPAVFATLIKAIYWILAFLFVLSNLGIEVGPLLAGLGIGGIAIAFALQGVLEDLFASFSIYFDKPFKVGDFITVGTDSGTVKKIGVKTTRIKTLQGQELIVSNKELTSSRVNNFKRMERRRIDMSIGVEYGTPVAKLKKINEIMKKIIDKEPQVTFGRSHFKHFGDFALKFEVIYFVETGDYDFYMDAQQSINMQVASAFEKSGISMAFPTQTVHVVKAKQ